MFGMAVSATVLMEILQLASILIISFIILIVFISQSTTPKGEQSYPVVVCAIDVP